MGGEGRGLWCYALFRARFLQGDFVGVGWGEVAKKTKTEQ
jgi:hypothetical protein